MDGSNITFENIQITCEITNYYKMEHLCDTLWMIYTLNGHNKTKQEVFANFKFCTSIINMKVNSSSSFLQCGQRQEMNFY